MDFNTIWAQIEPYFIIAVTFITGGGLTVLSVKTFIKKLIESFTQRINVRAIVDGTVNGVAAALLGGELNIDLSALTEDKLKELTDKLTDIVLKNIKEQTDKLDSIAELNVATADALTSLRAVSDEQKEVIREKAGKIRTGKPAPPKRVHKVKLEPVSVVEESKSEKSGISMG